MIIYKSGSELTLFSTEEAMLEYIEAIDVEEQPPKVIVSNGEVLKLTVTVFDSIRIERKDPTEYSQMRFRKLLRKFVARILRSGVRSAFTKDDELVARIAEKFYTE